MIKLQRHRRAARPVALALLLAASATVMGSTGTEATRPVAPAEALFTTIVVSPHVVPHPVRGADGLRHLAYELQVINPYVTVTLTRIETVDATTGDVLAALDGDAVASHMLPITADSAAGPTMNPGDVVLVVLDVALPPGRQLPDRLEHVISMERDPDIPGTPDVVRVAPVDVARDRAVGIDPPLAGDRWIVGNGCCAEATSHRSAANVVNGAYMIAQRFAIDFVQLDDDGRMFVGAPDVAANYAGYGADVLSVASGVVVAAQDGVPDNAPGTVPPIDLTLRTVPGNNVVVDIGGGRYAGYAHLQPGSLTVGVGDRVRRGEVLGLLGNSGNTDFPHLHFQVTDGPLFLGSNGIPYELRSFDSEGFLVGEDILAGEPAVIDPVLTGRHTRQLPLDLQVIGFGTGHR